MHRKTREIPAGQIVGFLALLVMMISLFYAVFAVAGPAPAAASTDILQPAVMAAANMRPVWNGYQPKRWTGPHPMCPASSYRLHRWARADKYGTWFRVECSPIGDGFYAWDGITKN